jgi:hypothetical protein
MSSLSSLITQLCYCASSFARVGLDFRIAMQPIIEESVLGIVVGGLDNAVTELKKRVEASLAADGSRAKLSEWLLDSDVLATSSTRRNPSSSSSTNTNAPSQRLVAFPALAEFTNDVLTTLNSLRLVAIPATYPKIRAALTNSLVECSDAFLRACQSITASFSSEEDKKIATNVGMALWGAKDGLDLGALPYLKAALKQGVYANYIGAPPELPDEREGWKDAREGWLLWSRDVAIELDLSEAKNLEPDDRRPMPVNGGSV